MQRLLKAANLGAAHGAWGEEQAVGYLRRNGYVILDRNARPVARDRRLEIDIVAYDSANDTLVFVEVKQHRSFSPYQRRLRSVNSRKLGNVRKAFNAWRFANRWPGGYRFDVIEVYGEPEGGSPIIDHIERVGLFVKQEQSVCWG